MTTLNWQAEEIEKKLLFSSNEFSGLTEEKKCTFSGIYKKFWFIYAKSWTLEQSNKLIEQERERLKKTKKKLDIGSLIFLVVIVLINYVRDTSSVEQGLAMMSAVLYYFWYINIIYAEDRMHHTSILLNKQSIDLLNVDISNLNLHLLPEAYRYMPIYEKYGGRFTEELNEDEQLVVKTFNVELDLAIMESLGVKIPNFWS